MVGRTLLRSVATTGGRQELLRSVVGRTLLRSVVGRTLLRSVVGRILLRSVATTGRR